MKKLFTLSVLLTTFTLAFTQEISYDEARKIAVEFFTNSESSKGILYQSDNVRVDTLKTYYTGISDMSKSGVSSRLPAFYIFNRNDTPGFVIVTADKRVRIIIAASMSQNMTYINPGLQVLLKQYVREIEYLKNIKAEETKSDYGVLQYTPGEWLLGGIEWNQGCYYNDQCPDDTRGTCGHVVAGCVATAMAQIMSYWNYPASNASIPGYQDILNYDGDGNVITDTDYTIDDVPSSAYSWANMPDKLSSSSTADEIDEVSKLINHCGVAVEMNYGPFLSTAYSNDVAPALEDYFDYSATCDLKNKFWHTWDGWYNMIKNEIDNERPIYYSAYDPDDPNDPGDPSGGHAFVLDGYKTDDTYHINWGWGGAANDFYPLTLLTPGSYYFEDSHFMVTGIEPDNPEQIPPQLILTSYTQEIGTDIILTFNEPMAETTLNPSNLIVYGSLSGTHPFSIVYDPGTNKCTISPDDVFYYNETVQITITTGVTDLASNSFDGDKNGTPGPSYTFAFTTEANPDLLSDGAATPSTGTTNDDITLSVVYTDPSGQTPYFIRAVVVGLTTDGLNYLSGQISTGAIFSMSRKYPVGTYEYYIETESAGGITDRWPKTGTRSFSVTQYVVGHDIAVENPNLPTSETPGGSFDITVSVRNYGDYTESNFPVEFYLYRPDGTQCDYDEITISSIAAGSSHSITTSLTSTSTTGFYTVNIIAGNPLDEDRSNNSISPQIYVGSNVDSDEYEARLFYLEVGQTAEFYEQDIYLHGANSNEAFFAFNGGSWDDYNKGQLTGVINDTYAIEYQSSTSTGVNFYFGPATNNQVQVVPNPVMGYQGDQKIITVTSPSSTTLSSTFTSTTGEGSSDGALISLWMSYRRTISAYQKEFTISMPADVNGDFDGWIKFSVGGGFYYNKVIDVTILQETRDLSVTVTTPVNGADINEGDDINASGTIYNNSNATEYVQYVWKLRNPQGTEIGQIPGSGTVPAHGSIYPSIIFTTNGLGAGVYTVSIELLNHTDDNPANDMSQVAVDILQPKIINADFIASVTSGNMPLTIDFSDLSTAENTTVTNWAWDFDGDDVIDDNTKNPTYTYISPGFYTVSLTASDGTISDIETKTDYIVVVQIAAEFISDITTGDAPLTVTFTDLSSSDLPLTSWHWNFGDGETSTDQNPVHVYDQGGLFSVNLIAGNEYGDDLILKEDYIEVTQLLEPPAVTTSNITSITLASASGGGNVTDDGRSAVVARGVCWDTSSMPTVDLATKSVDGTGMGEFSSQITGLTPGTTYYLRAYATNEMYTGYGDEIVFTTYNADAIQDADNNYYNIVTIGNQAWMSENLKTTKYNDETDIPLVTDISEWANLTTPAYCWYDNDYDTYGQVFGGLYNWYAVSSASTGGKNVCPVGWHIPSDEEWGLLETYLIENGFNYDGSTIGNKIAKSMATASGWEYSTTTGAIGNTDFPEKMNITGFSAMPGGFRNYTESYYGNELYGIWWTSDEGTSTEAYNRYMYFNISSVNRYNWSKATGLSVRCIKDELPAVTTKESVIKAITSATTGGYVTDDGGAAVTARGVCWDIYPEPTVDLVTKTVDGTDTGEFTSDISGLIPGTTYYLRAYATNSAGTGYGEEISFTTYNANAIHDVDDNYYNIVTIGNQTWMAENLKTTRFNDYTEIPNVIDATEWQALTTPAYCWYDNDEEANKNVYGGLYNWHTVNTGKLCPAGWHVPGDVEWKTLEVFLGMSQEQADAIGSRETDNEGGKLKETGLEHWLTPNAGATDEVGFTALPGGKRNDSGVFYFQKTYAALWWSSTLNSMELPLQRYLWYDNGAIVRIDDNKEDGMSIRCLRDVLPAVTTNEIVVRAITSAVSGGNVTSDGGAPVIARGVCWSTSPGPNVEYSTYTVDGAGNGEFSSSITDLLPGTTYYLRAYATNSTGTGYGDEIIFTTYNSDAVQDLDGNYYNTVIIGNQTWLAENLKTTLFNDNTTITNITDDNEWAALSAPAYCWYNNDYLNKTEYGALYNYYSVNTGKLCPEGWHVPSDHAWTVLTDYLGGEAVAGGKLKDIGTSHWADPNIGASNESGFTALPGGTRYISGGGVFAFLHSNAVFWTSTFRFTRSLFNDVETVFRGEFGNPEFGFSVRCMMNEEPSVETEGLLQRSINTAFSGGIVLSDGGSPIIVSGLCWSTSTGPTADLVTKTSDGTGIGEFTSEITGLAPGTTYYMRAYATNAIGTGYGEEIIFTTYNADAIQDIDGNYYNRVTIGSQTWLEENLRTTSYNDGTPISLITDQTEWSGLSTPAYCWYNNDPTIKDTYGALYNWHAATQEILCPTGWHVPTYEEWYELITLYGGESYAGMYLKEAGTDHWLSPNSGTNESGFTALPGGSRHLWTSGFMGLETDGGWWCSTGNSYAPTIYWYMASYADYAAWEGNSATTGYSIRCIQDTKTQQIDLTEGWNLVSFAVEPDELSMSSVFADLTDIDPLVKVQDEEGRALERLTDPFGWINDIGMMNNSEGYKLRVSESGTLSLTGRSVDIPVTIPLEKGWNFIGYPFLRSQDAYLVFNQLVSSGTLIKVQNEEGASIEQINDQWVVGFSNLHSGEGYKVKTNEATTLSFQVTSKGSLISEERTTLKPSHFIPAYRGNGLDHMNIYLSDYSEEGWSLHQGDEIGIFDEGVCVGAAVVENTGNKYISVIVSLDDPVTQQRDGFTEGDEIEVRLWDNDAKEVRNTSHLEPVPGYSILFEKLGTAVLKVKFMEGGRSYLGDAYPNPSGEKTTFTFVVADESNVRFEIFDIKGQKVKILLNKTMPAGEYTLEWDNRTEAGNKAKSGYYLYQLQCNDIIQTKQLVIH